MAQLPTYNRQVTTQGLGAGPVNLPTTSTDQQMLNVGTDAAARATDSITQQVNDTAFQDTALKLDNARYNLLNQVRQKQGGNALGSSDEALKQFDDVAGMLGQEIPAARRDAWRQQVGATRLQLQSTADVHEYQQYQDYSRGQLVGREQMAINDAQTYRDDTQNYKISQAKAEEAIRSFGAANGWSEQETNGRIAQLNLQMSSQAIDARIADIRAQPFLRPATFTPGNMNQGAIFSSMITGESGGRQLDANGLPLTSSEGAIGVAQMLESTAKETAQQHGIEWDPQKFRFDTSYNMSLGNLYQKKLAQKYNDNPALYVAAYNAGPGAVDDWINGTNKSGKNGKLTRLGDPNKGEISNDQFIANIPFDETRSYTMGVLARAQSLPPEADLSQIEKMPWYENASPQLKGQLIAQLGAEVTRQRAYGLQNLQDEMQSNTAQMQNGIMPSRDISRGEFLSYLPPGANAYQLEALNRQYDEYQANKALVPTYNTIMSQPAGVAYGAVENLRPSENTPNAATQWSIYSRAAQRLSQVQQERKSDPGGWLIKNSPLVQHAYQDYSQDSNRGQQLVMAVESEKKRLGIVSDKVLPDNFADNLTAQIDGGQMKFTELQDLFHGFGSYADKVAAQIQGKVKGAVGVAMGVNDQNAANTLFTIRNTKTEDLKKNAGEQAKNVDTAWNSLISEISPTFSLQMKGGADTLSDINDQGKRLAYFYMASGDDAQAAAKKAYQKILGDYYTIHETWRMPNILGLQEHNVADGLHNIINGLKPDNIGNKSLFHNPVMTPEQNAANNLAQIKNSGEWVTDENEQGVYLTVNGTYIEDNEGNPLHVTFSDASRNGITNPGFIGKVMNLGAEKQKTTIPTGFYTPNVNASMSDAFRVLRGEDATEPAISAPSREAGLRDALNHRGGQQ